MEVMNNRNVFSDEKEALEKSLKTTRMEKENQRKWLRFLRIGMKSFWLNGMKNKKDK